MGSRGWVGVALAGLLFGGLLVLRALDTAVVHDEDQYIAGAVLATDRLIFRDFMHLQTPLQAMLFAPLAELFPSQPFSAMRAANALAGAATAVALFGAMRAAGAGMRAAAVATLMFAVWQPYQMAACVVRNDILPSLFSALGLLAAVAAVRRPSRPGMLWGLAGLGFGLATSAKISHAFLAAGAGLFLLLRALRSGNAATWRDLAGFGAGGLVGLLPTIAVFLAAPRAAFWGIVEYGSTAPFDWYRRNGLAEMLSLPGKLEASFDFLHRSFVLPVLAVVLVMMIRRRGTPRPEAVLLDTLVVAGLVASLLPTPTWQFYFLPLLLPLFVRFALWLEPYAERWPTISAGAAAVMLAVLVAQQLVTIDWGKARVTLNAADGLRMADVEAEADWVGDRLRAAGAVGSIATLSPHAVLGNGYPLDPRFATGVFVYRSGNLLTQAEHERFHTVGPATLAASLDRVPPAAIVVGHERGSKLFRIRPDDGLRAYAQARGYRLERKPVGHTELYINPRTVAQAGP